MTSKHIVKHGRAISLADGGKSTIGETVDFGSIVIEPHHAAGFSARIVGTDVECTFAADAHAAIEALTKALRPEGEQDSAPPPSLFAVLRKIREDFKP